MTLKQIYSLFSNGPWFIMKEKEIFSSFKMNNEIKKYNKIKMTTFTRQLNAH